MKWFVRGDVDGFFGLALDNLVQLLLIDALCRVRARLPAGAALRPRPAGRRGLDPGRQPLLRLAGEAARARAPGAPTSARCPTASTPSRSSPTSSWSCCRRSSPPRPPARPIRRASPGRRGSSPALGSGLIELARRARRRARPQGDAARGAALDARRHRAQLHLARLPLPHLRAADRRPDDARRSCC